MAAPVSPQELSGFFATVTHKLEQLSLPYMVAGGFAAIFYGEPRLTVDIDIVVDINTSHIQPLLAAFPFPDYYLSEEAMRDSIRRRFPFNIIQTLTAAKVDLIPLPDDVFSRMAFSRRQQMAFNQAGAKAWFISAEDMVLAKLFAWQQTGSDKHLRDVKGVLVTQWGSLNLDLIRRAADQRGLLARFEQLYEVAREELEE
ncbi:MAG: hypothetical protein Kow0031_26050 [Anaerolineae bacterium]